MLTTKARRHEEEREKGKLVELTFGVAVKFECGDVDLRWPE
jgi:hypothetical protein